MAFPYILLQLWNFISPALYENERKYAKLFIFIASLLFFTGVLFGYFVVVPMSVNFFATFKVSDVVQNQFSFDSYIGMIKTSVIASGLFFELPVIIYFLTKLGLVTPKFLRDYWRYAVVIILIVAAIVTPPDVVSQLIVAIPMLLIYEISIFISVIVYKNQQQIKLKIGMILFSQLQNPYLIATGSMNTSIIVAAIADVTIRADLFFIKVEQKE